MTLKERVRQDLERLDEGNLREVADFEFRTRRNAAPQWDDTAMATLYAEFAEEARTLAAAGMSDYAAGLAREDDAR